MKINLNTPVSAEREPVALTGRLGRHARTTEIAGADVKSPADHAVNTVEPHANADEYRRQVRDYAAALGAADALDEDNLEALSSLIGALLQTWAPRVRRAAAHRREVAELLLAQNLQHQAVVTEELASLCRARAEVTNVRQEILRQAGFAGELLSPSSAARPEILPPASRVRALRNAPAAGSPAESVVRSATSTAPSSDVAPFGFAASAEFPLPTDRPHA